MHMNSGTAMAWRVTSPQNAVVSQPIWMLETKPWSSERSIQALNHRGISSAPLLLSFNHQPTHPRITQEVHLNNKLLLGHPMDMFVRDYLVYYLLSKHQDWCRWHYFLDGSYYTASWEQVSKDLSLSFSLSLSLCLMLQAPALTPLS